MPASAPWPVQAPVDSLLLKSTVELAQMIRAGEVSPTEVVRAHIRRIEQVNPTINAVIQPLFEQAMAEARAAEERLAHEEADTLPPFLGVPFTTKENYQVTGLPNTGGLVRRRRVQAPEDATLVKRMREAGFILLGTTNVPEGLMWFESYNRVYGRTTNAYSERHTSGGSSGGEGSIIGAGGSPVGLGGDIGGSIRNPAFFNGIVGHKASGGRVPDTGTWPGGRGMIARYKVCGPLCRRVADVEALMPLLSGPDGHDTSVDGPAWQTDFQMRPEDVTVYWYDRIGMMKPSADIKAMMQRLASTLEERGYRVQRWAPEGLKHALEMWFTALGDAGGNSFVEVLGDFQDVRLGREWLKWPLGKSRHIFPSLALATLEVIAHRLLGERETRSAALIAQLQHALESQLGQNNVWITPTFHRSAPRHGWESVKHTLGFINAGMLNPLQMPATAVPTGFDSEGLPMGVQVAASRNRDELAIAVARDVEDAFGGWRPAELR